MKKSIADLIAFGISSRCTSHFLSLASGIQSILSSAKTEAELIKKAKRI